MTTLSARFGSSKLVAGLLTASLAFGAGCGGLPAGAAATPPTVAASQSALSFSPSGAIKVFLDMADSLVDDLFIKGISSLIFGDGFDYEKFQDMLTKDLADFAKDQKVKDAVATIAGGAETLREIAAGEADKDIPSLAQLWSGLNDALAQVSRDEDIRAQGLTTYLYGATIQHAIFQEMIAMDKTNADTYAQELKSALEEHIRYVKEELAKLDGDHQLRLSNVNGYDKRSGAPTGYVAGQCELYKDPIIGYDPNHYNYYVNGDVDWGNDPKLPHPDDEMFQKDGQDHDYGTWHYLSGTSSDGGSIYFRVWQVYNDPRSAAEHCATAMANFKRDYAAKLGRVDHTDEAHAMLDKWEQALANLK